VAVTTELASLNSISLFQGVPEADLKAVRQRVQVKRLPVRTALMRSEEPGDLVYIIASGTVKVHREQEDGTEIILAILRAGEIAGEMAAIDSLGRSASVTTLEASTLLVMERSLFRSMLREMPAVALNLVRILSRRIRYANAHIAALAALDARGRVACELLVLARDFGSSTSDGMVIPFCLSQSELAGLVGATRVRVNQVLSEYRQHDFIGVDADSHIVIKNPTALAHLCH